jgi:hypothetical protein
MGVGGATGSRGTFSDPLSYITQGNRAAPDKPGLTQFAKQFNEEPELW